MRLLICALFVIAAGCSNSPTSPTQASAATGPLRWDVMSASCAPVAPPAPLPDVSTASVRIEEDDARLTASWPYSLNGRSVTLYGTFVRENGAWALCSWDTADV